MAFEIITTDLKLDQRVSVQRERGTREFAYVKGLTGRGQVVVRLLDNSFEIVDREDIET